jgi:hypothetical protein
METFLSQRETKSDDYTYQSMISKKKYLIDDIDYHEFIKLYTNALSSGETVSILTKPRKCGATTVRIDVDIKLPETYEVPSIYTDQDIDTMLDCLVTVMNKHVKNITERNTIAFILEKEHIQYKDGMKKKGFHIEFPFLCIPVDQQESILFPHFEEACSFLFERYKGIAIGTIFDTSASLKNAWLMYGSKKSSNAETYKITRTVPHYDYNEADLPHLLSIHDKYHKSDIKDCHPDYDLALSKLSPIPEVKNKDYVGVNM